MDDRNDDQHPAGLRSLSEILADARDLQSHHGGRVFAEAVLLLRVLRGLLARPRHEAGFGARRGTEAAVAPAFRRLVLH